MSLLFLLYYHLVNIRAGFLLVWRVVGLCWITAQHRPKAWRDAHERVYWFSVVPCGGEEVSVLAVAGHYSSVSWGRVSLSYLGCVPETQVRTHRSCWSYSTKARSAEGLKGCRALAEESFMEKIINIFYESWPKSRVTLTRNISMVCSLLWPTLLATVNCEWTEENYQQLPLGLPRDSCFSIAPLIAPAAAWMGWGSQ